MSLATVGQTDLAGPALGGAGSGTETPDCLEGQSMRAEPARRHTTSEGWKEEWMGQRLHSCTTARTHTREGMCESPRAPELTEGLLGRRHRSDGCPDTATGPVELVLW